MLPKVAAVTMVFDEPDYLPVWARHYARQVGADQCYVIDHGSTMPVSVTKGVNVVRIPRSAHDDTLRASFIADFTTSLLRYYDWVIYTDVDEIVLADPAKHASLPALCKASDRQVLTAVGLDVQQSVDTELGLETSCTVGSQRNWVRFTSAMCKPILTCIPLVWSPGFHTASLLPSFDDVYLFHLHWADQAIGLRRLAKTRAMTWANDGSGMHQRISEAQWLELFHGMARLPKRRAVGFAPDEQPLADWLDQTISTAALLDNQPAAIRLDLNAPELWPIPERFRNRL